MSLNAEYEQFSPAEMLMRSSEDTGEDRHSKEGLLADADTLLLGIINKVDPNVPFFVYFQPSNDLDEKGVAEETAVDLRGTVYPASLYVLCALIAGIPIDEDIGRSAKLRIATESSTREDDPYLKSGGNLRVFLQNYQPQPPVISQ